MSAPAIEVAPIHSAPNSAAMLEVPLAWLVPSSFNPRRTFDDAALDELAASLAQHGMLEPIVVREVAWPDTYQVRNAAGEVCPCYEIICGERRWRAANRAKLERVPVRILTGIDDRTALELSVVENLQRVDLDPIEEAQGYAALRDHAGMTQTEIAAAVKRSQPAVAKSIGLLKLPDEVREQIRTGTLAPAHGYALAKWSGFPRYAQALAQEVAAGRLTAKQLDGRHIHCTYEMAHAGIIQSIGYNALFDTEACKQCPFGAYRTDEYGRGYCLRPEHYRELEEQAKQAQRERLAAAAAAQSDAKAGGEPLTPAALPHLQDMRYETYKTFGSQAPAGCTKDCPCRAQAINQRGHIEAICIDPKRYEKLQAAEKRATNKAKRERVANQLAALGEHLQGLEAVDGPELALLIVACFSAYVAHDKALKEAIDAHLPGLLDPSKSPEREDLARLAPLDLIRFAVHRYLAQELYRTVENEWSTAPTYAWYERQMSLARKERKHGN